MGIVFKENIPSEGEFILMSRRGPANLATDFERRLKVETKMFRLIYHTYVASNSWG